MRVMRWWELMQERQKEGQRKREDRSRLKGDRQPDIKRCCFLLTATKRSHLSILCVDLGDISDPLTQHVHRDLITVLVLPVGCFIPCSLNLGLTVSYAHTENKNDYYLICSSTNKGFWWNYEDACFSPVIPDMTQPMFSVILNRWVTVEASRSLSWGWLTHGKIIHILSIHYITEMLKSIVES